MNPNNTEGTKKRRSPGIRVHLFAYMMIFLLILLGLLWLFQVVFFEEIYKSVKIGEIEEAAIRLSEGRELETKAIDELAGQIAQEYEVCVLIFDANGNVIATKDILQDCIIHRMTSRNIFMLYTFAKQNGGEKLSRYQRETFKDVYHEADFFKGDGEQEDGGLAESIIYTKIAYSEGRQRDLIVILNTTISPVGSTVKAIQTELLMISAVMALAALLLSYFLARRISRPIIRINAGAKLLGEGKYDVRFPESGYRELAELAGTLNYASQELSKTETLQRELIANISHDLRTPLTMMEGYAEMMRDIPGENTPENAQIIIDETRRLTSLVNDVLDISRIQAGTQQLTMSDFNLTETVREVIGRFSKLTSQDGWTIEFHAGEEVMVHADRTRILQVIYNFINNAITHAGGDRTVLVSQQVKSDGERQTVRLSVTDHGEGIPADKLGMIWDRYYKVDKLHRRAQTGSGLGLSIVKGILEQHHAAYGVESREGEGSTFWFEL